MFFVVLVLLILTLQATLRHSLNASTLEIIWSSLLAPDFVY